MELVGHLQVTDQPLLSLYVTQRGDALFFFYRLKRNEYYLTRVKPSDVIAYLDEKMGLLQIFMASDDYLYHHKTRHSAVTTDFITIDDAKRNELQHCIESFNMYDDLFGMDEIKVRHYIMDIHIDKRIESHKELAYG
ncbi:MAG: hypothetical protein IJ683_07110 [Butyrivibrio sp.]|nr:hypothetical protein [Butyrivibrio sp.]MBR1642072.1 hypothetical protein [Butyrivibrio sp.]